MELNFNDNLFIQFIQKNRRRKKYISSPFNLRAWFEAQGDTTSSIKTVPLRLNEGICIVYTLASRRVERRSSGKGVNDFRRVTVLFSPPPRGVYDLHVG